jgi:hypothetical protein
MNNRPPKTIRQIPSAVDAPARWQPAEALRYRCLPWRGPPCAGPMTGSQRVVVLAETALAALAGKAVRRNVIVTVQQLVRYAEVTV